MIYKTQNFKKLRDLLDENKYSNEFIQNLLDEALTACLSYTKRQTLPNISSNKDIFNYALAILNKTRPPYEALGKYIFSYLGGYTCIIVSNLPAYQERDVVYAIRGAITTKFVQNGIVIDTQNNDNDDSPYTDEDGNLFQNHKINIPTYDNYEDQTFPISGGE